MFRSPIGLNLGEDGVINQTVDGMWMKLNNSVFHLLRAVLRVFIKQMDDMGTRSRRWSYV